MKNKALALLLCIVFLFSLFGCELILPQKILVNSTELSEDIGLRAHFIDVDQGDCILLESKGEFALIDAGEYKEKDTVVSYLSSVGVTELDYVISTHPHSDHCGSLSEVIRSFDCSVLLSPDADTDSNVWEYVLDAADERGVTLEIPDAGDVYTLGSSTITILSPAKNAVYSSLNDYSIVCMVEYENTSLLLTGDAEKIVENELLSSGYDLSADVYKCGHHGSTTSNCDDFLDAVNPSAAIISCGKDNEYGHPHDEVIESLEERGIPYWRTDTDGDIIMLSDGENISISTANEADITVTAPENTARENISYVGNKNSKVFHESDCSSVEATKEKNKVYFDNRQDAVDEGYTPCKACNP